MRAKHNRCLRRSSPIIIPDVLEGGARHCYALNANMNTFSEFVRDFEEAFCERKSLTERHAEMIARIQRRGEATDAYVYEKASLCRKLDLNHRGTCEQITVGLFSRGSANAVALNQYTSVNDLLHDVLRLEKISLDRGRAHRLPFRQCQRPCLSGKFPLASTSWRTRHQRH